MNLNHLSSLAIHYLGYLATADTSFVEAGKIRQALGKTFGIKMQGISYFYYMTNRLITAKLVKGRRGPGGGLQLLVPANKLTLARVVEAVEGPLVEKRCAVSYKDQACKLKGACLLDEIMRRVGRCAQKELEAVTVLEFGKRLRRLLKK